MRKHFHEERDIPVAGDYDVVVVGGGVAGVSAALAARRAGCSTLLLEKGVMLGGLATLGMIAVYLPLCDGNGRKVVGGIAEELLRASIKYGHHDLPSAWLDGTAPAGTTERYQTSFLPGEFVLALDEIVEVAGVDVLYDTVFSDVLMDDGHCRAVIVESKSGRVAYVGKVFVDACGDSDVMVRAQAEWVEQDNFLSYWAFTTNLDRMQNAVRAGDVMKGIYLEWWGGINDGTGCPEGARKYLGSSPEEVTRFVIEGRRMVRRSLLGRDATEAAVVAIPGMAQLRTTRRIRGLYELRDSDILQHFHDSIGCVGDWRRAGPILEVPYRSLIAQGIENIITAGRTIASAGEAWEIARVIPGASLTGQAAGTAAALSVRQGRRLQELKTEELQHMLEDTGVMIHF